MSLSLGQEIGVNPVSCHKGLVLGVVIGFIFGVGMKDREIIIKLPEELKKKMEQSFIDFWCYGESSLELTDEDIKQIEIVKQPE